MNRFLCKKRTILRMTFLLYKKAGPKSCFYLSVDPKPPVRVPIALSSLVVKYF